MIKRKILISEENKEAIAEFLKQVQGRVHVRCFNADDILSLTWEADMRLNELQLPKKYQIATIVHYSEYATKKAKKWSEDITEVKLKRDKQGWVLICADRILRSWEGPINHLLITDEAINYVTNSLRHLKLES